MKHLLLATLHGLVCVCFYGSNPTLFLFKRFLLLLVFLPFLKIITLSLLYLRILILAFLKYWDFGVTKFSVVYRNLYNTVVWHLSDSPEEKELTERDPVLRARADAY